MEAAFVDMIAVRGVRAYGRHGVTQSERARPQPLDIDVELDVDLTRAGSTDALSDTVDYDELHARLVRVVQTTSFSLLERLGEELVREVFSDARVAAVRISIAKPALLAGSTPSVQLRRENDRFSQPR